MLAGAMSWGLALVLMKRVDWEMPVIALAGWQSFLGGLPIVAVAVVKDPVFQSLSAGALGSVLYNIFIAGRLVSMAGTRSSTFSRPTSRRWAP